MQINLDFKYLDELINKLAAEHNDEDDILSDYELRKEELQEDVDKVLENTYGLISNCKTIEKDEYSCECAVEIRLQKLKHAELNEVNRLSISFCQEHDSAESDKLETDELRAWATEYAEKLWLEDEMNKATTKYSKLFELTGV